jgi:hypothetical protein
MLQPSGATFAPYRDISEAGRWQIRLDATSMGANPITLRRAFHEVKSAVFMDADSLYTTLQLNQDGRRVETFETFIVLKSAEFILSKNSNVGEYRPFVRKLDDEAIEKLAVEIHDSIEEDMEFENIFRILKIAYGDHIPDAALRSIVGFAIEMNGSGYTALPHNGGFRVSALDKGASGADTPTKTVSRKSKKGRKIDKIADEKVLATLKANGDSISKTAKALNVQRYDISDKIKNTDIPELARYGAPKLQPPTAAEVKVALDEAGGNRNLAANILNAQFKGKRTETSGATISKRIYKAKKNPRSPLHKAKNSSIDKELIVDALAMFNGSRRKTAAYLTANGHPIVESTITHHIKHSKEGSNLYKYREISAAGERKTRFSDKEIAESFIRNDFDTQAALDDLSSDGRTATYNMVYYRVKRAKKGSPLLGMKISKGVSNIELAYSLAKHEGNRRDAARELGLDPSTVTNRVQAADGLSPLCPFKEQIVGGQASRFRPAMIYEAYLATGKRIPDVAILFETNSSNIYGIISRAPEYSVLERIAKKYSSQRMSPSRIARVDTTIFSFEDFALNGSENVSDGRLAFRILTTDNLSESLCELGLSPDELFSRLERAPIDSVLSHVSHLTASDSRTAEETEQLIAYAMDYTGGDTKATSLTLDYPEQQLLDGITNSSANSILSRWKNYSLDNPNSIPSAFKVAREGFTYSDVEVALTLRGPSALYDALSELWIPLEELFGQIKSAPFNSPLTKYEYLTTNNAKRKEHIIAYALDYYDEDLAAIEAATGTAIKNIDLRIKSCSDHSPLAAHRSIIAPSQTIHERPIYKAMKKHNNDIELASQETGYTEDFIDFMIFHAGVASPLREFRGKYVESVGLSYDPDVVPLGYLYSDRALEEAINEEGGFFEAASKLNIPIKTLVEQIYSAPYALPLGHRK